MKSNLQERSDRSREKILNQLKAAQNTKDGLISERGQSVRVFLQPNDLLQAFCQELEAIKGTVIIGENMDQLKNSLVTLLEEKGLVRVFCRDNILKSWLGDDLDVSDEQKDFIGMEVGITRCEYLIARTGSVLVSSAHESGRLMNVFPPIHIVVAKASQLVPFLEEAIVGVKERYNNSMPSQLTVITGASRTADIEKTLVMGAHGPKEIFVLIDKNN